MIFSDFEDFTDSFDALYGTTDLGYNDDDLDLFPTVSTAVFHSFDRVLYI